MFGQDIFDLEDDGFEGSNEELRISQEVFYGNAAVGCSKKCDATGGTTSLTESHKMLEISPSSHSENSAVTNQASPKDVSQKEAASAEIERDSQVSSSAEGSIMDEMIDHDVHAKRMRYSVNELSNFKPYLDKAVISSIPLKQVVSEAYRPVLPAPCQILMCHVVESCSEGVTSSCYLLKQYPESDQEGNLADSRSFNCSLSGSDGSEVKQVGVSNSIASPISQESSATKLLVPSPTAVAVSESESLQHADRRPRKTTYSECEDDEILNGDSMKDSHAILRSRAYLLLERAGWSPERHVRNDGRNRYVYRSPEGKIFREFPKVWNLLGQRLLAHGNNKIKVDDKQWTTVDEFCSDLFETLRYIDNTMNDLEPKCSLTCQWRLLDPFVNVILVNRKMHALRAGKLVKAKQSNVSDVDGKAQSESRFKYRKGDRKRPLDGHAEKTFCSPSMASDMVGTHKTSSIYVSEGNNMRLVKTIAKTGNCDVGACTDELNSCRISACESDSTCLQHPAYLYDVPVGTAETKAIYGHSSPHQASCISSPSYNKQNLELSKESSKDSAVCLLEEVAEPLERFTIDGVKKMDCMSEGFSGVELSKLCREEADVVREANDRSGQLNLVDIQGWSMDYVDNDASLNKFSTNFLEHPSVLKRSLPGKSYRSRHRSGCCLEELNAGRDADKPLHAYSGSIESQSCKQRMTPKKNYSKKRRSMGCRLKDDDLLISAIIKKRTFRSRVNDCGPLPGKFKVKSPKKRKTQKGSCRLLLRSLGKGGKHFTERWALIGERTILAWLISAGSILVNEAIQYRDPKDDAVVKEGLVTKDGILCNCCNEVFPVSQFKIHAGFNQNRPCLNLFVGSGRPYTLCQLQAWSAEYKVRRSGARHVPLGEFDKNDDSCGICGDGGELLCCDNCPSTFHQSCLSAEELPEGSWYCPDCTCQICGALANDTEPSSSYAAVKCSQCDKKYHQLCLTDKGMSKDGGASWFCSSDCEEVFVGLQSRIGLSNQIADEYSWTLLRCIHDEQKVPSAQRFALKAECNSKLAVAVTIMEECFLSMIDPRTGIDMIPQVVYNWGSEFARLDYHGFYTAVLEKNDVLVSVASIRVHGVAVAEMPLIATCSKYRRQGMCRRLLNCIEKMLISLKVEKLVVAAISDLVETWTIGFGFVPMEEDEKRSLSKINFMVFPGTVMLKKTLYVNQASDLQKGVEDISALGSDDSCKIGICFEGDPKIDAIYGNTEEDIFIGGANELEFKPISSPDSKTAQKRAGTAEVECDHLNGLGSLEQEDKVTVVKTGLKREELFHALAGCERLTNYTGESKILQFGSLGMIESDNLVSSEFSVVGSEIKLLVEDQDNCLQVAKDQDIVKTVECMEIPPARNMPSNRTERVTVDKPCKFLEVQDCLDQDNPFWSQSAGECLNECVLRKKETHVGVTHDVATHVESTFKEAESVSELRNHVTRNDLEGGSTIHACKASQDVLTKLANSEAVMGYVEGAEAMKITAACNLSESVAIEMVNPEAAEEDEQSCRDTKVEAASHVRDYASVSLMNIEAVKEAVEASVGIDIEATSDISKNMLSRMVNLEEVKEDEEAAESMEVGDASTTRSMRGNVLVKEGDEVTEDGASSKSNNVVNRDDEAADCLQVKATTSNTSDRVKINLVNLEPLKEGDVVADNLELGAASNPNENVMIKLVNSEAVEEDIYVANGLDVEVANNTSKNPTIKLVNSELVEENEEDAEGIEIGAASIISGDVTINLVSLEAMKENEAAAVATPKLSNYEAKEEEQAPEVMEVEAVSKEGVYATNKLVISEAVKDVQTVEGIEISSASNMSDIMTTHSVILRTVREDKEVAVEATETGAEPIGHSDSLDEEISLERRSSESCEYNVPVVIQEGVSGQETQCVSVENQLSLIEQSQQASVLPQS
ncbi:increased DNA methylation 1 [Beta vulgaris subsp. vulgaris]|uniref:increased DNA methylation 1 n=1 Tax=Beta vulgaris subsp. vulgaris TaxID=3555 RepID=UPI0020372D38|nr:increased DNA methylation 1 [Beta vulgaris subsp. vulgaris]